jgi:hypothetical protein
MDEEVIKPPEPDRLYGHTTDRVADMTDEARVELHRKLAGRTAGVTDTPYGRSENPHDPLVRRPENADPAAIALRLEAELHRVERRLDRLDRSVSHSRYQTGSAQPSGRYARLVSRARRLERQLRAVS